MTGLDPMTSIDDRLLTFEIENALYAMPISGVLEVAEVDRVTCVPTIDADHAGVMNWHGEALPLLDPCLLLDPADARPQSDLRRRASRQVLVVTDRPGGAGRLGLPVLRVLGLVDGPKCAAKGTEVVMDRRSEGGRVMTVIDPHRLVEWAVELIERMVA